MCVHVVAVAIQPASGRVDAFGERLGREVEGGREEQDVTCPPLCVSVCKVQYGV